MGKPRRIFEPQRAFKRDQFFRGLSRIFLSVIGIFGVGLFICGVIKWGWIVCGIGLSFVFVALFTPKKGRLKLEEDFSGTFCTEYRQLMGVRRLKNQ